MEYDFGDEHRRIDIEAVWRFLSEDAYWGGWRSRDDVERQVAGAWRVVGCFERGSGDLVGFARAASDGIGFAYLADVFVLPGHRGGGLGYQLATTMIEDGQGAGFRWLLHTADAHGLYAKFGFAEPDHMLLERPHASSRGADPAGT